jgi:hypothetical protein
MKYRRGYDVGIWKLSGMGAAEKEMPLMYVRK